VNSVEEGVGDGVGAVVDGGLGGLADEEVEGGHVAAGAFVEVFGEADEGVGGVVVQA
jgi:hypothetical protein